MPRTRTRQVQYSPPSRREAGFTLIELLIALLVMVEVLVAILLLFTSLSDLSRVQTDVAEMQQGQRIGQRTLIEVVRNAGFGGMPATVRESPGAPGEFPTGLAIGIQNNVPTNHRITGGTSDEVLAGSDVLTVRGVFSTPLYYLAPEQIDTRDEAGGDATSLLDVKGAVFEIQGETIQIPESFGPKFNDAGLRRFQSLTPVFDALTEEPVQVLIVRDLTNPGAYALLETNGIANDYRGSPGSCACACGCLEVAVNLSTASHKDKYADLMAGSTLRPGSKAGYQVEIDAGRTVPFPRHIGAVGILDEYRYYLRPDGTRTMLLADSVALMPTLVLSRISVLPGTDQEIGDRVDIADNLLDLQIVVGVDSSAAADPGRGQIFEDGSQADEVWFNHSADVPLNFTAANNSPEIHFVRLTTLVHTGRPERGYRARPLLAIEDTDRSGSFTVDGVTFNYNTGLANYRRRLLTTTIDMRNLQ